MRRLCEIKYHHTTLYDFLKEINEYFSASSFFYLHTSTFYVDAEKRRLIQGMKRFKLLNKKNHALRPLLRILDNFQEV